MTLVNICIVKSLIHSTLRPMGTKVHIVVTAVLQNDPNDQKKIKYVDSCETEK